MAFTVFVLAGCGAGTTNSDITPIGSASSSQAASGGTVSTTTPTPTPTPGATATPTPAATPTPTPTFVNTVNTSGGVAAATVGGRNLVFVAGQIGGVIEIADVTNPSSPTLTVQSVNITGNLGGGGFQGLEEIDGLAVLPVGTTGNPQILLYSWSNSVFGQGVMLVDASTLAVVNSATLPITHTITSANLGTSPGYITGAIPDVGGFWLTTGDGVEFLNASTMTLSNTLSYPGGNNTVFNMGADMIHRVLFCPTESNNPAVTNGTVGLVQLPGAGASGGSIFGLDPALLLVPPLSGVSGALPAGGAGGMTSSEGGDTNQFAAIFSQGTVDSSLQVGIAVQQSGFDTALFNLNGATTTAANSTWDPPAANGIATVALSALAGSNLLFGQVTCDPTTHLVFYADESAANLAVGQIQNPSGATPWTGLTDWRTTQTSALGAYNLPTAQPHDVAIVTLNGKPFGFRRTAGGVIMVDLQAFFASTPDAAGVLADGHFVTAPNGLTLLNFP